METLTGRSVFCAGFIYSYTLRVVGNGIKAQSANPEVKVKGADPVINQIIDKLKHINQVHRKETTAHKALASKS
ncbi:Glypican-5 [Liparis tanakae]|uniref:Glypican-5 n=1 Tax=Liparis tanakae TaxID=230148 RepID=A0A4Z2HN28_9TELE|nr:Glypican-5 [Liparis tanakae]